jgi:SAM-dependent methyltransferase
LFWVCQKQKTVGDQEEERQSIYIDILIKRISLFQFIKAMSSLDDSAKIFDYHRDLIKEHGADSPFALGWRNKHDQQVRFGALAQIADLNGRSVLDAGCGYADLYPFLKERFPRIKSYCGIEQIPELAGEAIRKYGYLADTRFIARSFLHGELPGSDYVFASGSLNYGSNRPGSVYSAIARLYKTCCCGMAFNLLKYMPADGTLVAYDPKDIIAFCRTLTNEMVYKDDYAPEDFTIFLYKCIG